MFLIILFNTIIFAQNINIGGKPAILKIKKNIVKDPKNKIPFFSN